MLGKRYSLGSIFEPTGEPLVKVANFKELAQQSEDIKSFLATFKPDPGYMYLHVIAVGAGEYYSSNINGDYFPEADLIARHKTFETDARVYREHDNKPYSESYGNVSFAWYNPKMHRVELILAIDKVKGKEFVDRQNAGEQLCVSMGCFPAGTDVLLADNTFKHIEDINPGDKVITHTGEEHEVTTKMLHDYTGNMCRIKVSGKTQQLVCTDNHPILVRRYNTLPTDSEGKCPLCKKAVKDVRTHIKRSKDSHHKKYWKKALESLQDFTEAWVQAKDITTNDYLVTPTPSKGTTKKKCSKKDIAFSKILGYFIAEGSYRHNRKKEVNNISFVFNINEIGFQKEVIKCLNILCPKKKPYINKRPKKSITEILLCDKNLSQKIYSYVGEYSHTKYINKKILSLTEEERLYILGKYIDGDGTYVRRTGDLQYITVSKNLSSGLCSLAASLGLAIYESEVKLKSLSYVGTIRKGTYEILARYSTKANMGVNKKPYFLRNNWTFNDKGTVVHKVKSIETYHVDNLPVYNLSVECDESYTANNIAVHNCRVKADFCSICNNKASKPHEYCSHIKYHKNEIFPDGKKAYMINYNPTFFD